MKLCCVVAVAVLVVALCSQAQSQNSIMGPDECCFKYYTKGIPVKQVKSYKTTNPNCPTKGVIFITVKDKRVCANPEVKQVQDIMEKVDKLWDPEPTPSSR
ncbi:C-C motif chemokine 4 homolog [Clupea harengus]|uniref:C-C motif chemokine n=1 Tax=Clupea harengus TaxID=7950 RepID=A0A6P3VTP7_CLUHA|nr:C-C motif chemokine 4 homolog [Clupea harengus]